MIHAPFDRDVDGRRVRGDVHVPDGPPPRSAVVVAHGFKGFKDWGFFPWVCRRLAGAGYAVVSFNFSGSGIGADPERFTELDAFAANTFSHEVAELARVVGWVREGALTPRRPDRLGLLGHSRGGGDAVLVARDLAEVDALVTWSAVSTFDRWSAATRDEWRSEGRVYVPNKRTGQQMPLGVGLLEDLEANRDRLDVGAAAAEVAVPWLIVHGTADETVPVEEGEELARRSRGSRLHRVEGAGHTFGAGHPFDGPGPWLEEAMEATLRHFRAHAFRE